jgi:4-hydroxybenzoyl-CoA reductase subunit beta
MMRLPHFRYLAPADLREASAMLADHGPDAMVMAGGTDLLPNMKRRQQVPKVVVGLRSVPGLRESRNGSELALGAGLTMTDLVRDLRVREQYAALWQASAQVATPQIRNIGTLGGNLCIDTRCNYYDQTYEWRKSIGFCMKKDGEICWVATSSPKCLAVTATDIGPALMALGARVKLVSAKEGERILTVSELYHNDGIDYLTRRPDEIVSEVLLNPADGWRSAYWKLRRRGSIDFPVLSVAAAVRTDADGVVLDARIVLGSVSSKPLDSAEAAQALRGKRLTDGVIEQAAELAYKIAKPMDNTDFVLHWRKRVSREFVVYALRDLRGDDMREQRIRVARRPLNEEIWQALPPGR